MDHLNYYKDNQEHILIKNTINDVPVTCVSSGELMLDNVKTLCLNHDCRIIEKNSFINCNNLEEVVFSDSIVYIGENSFTGANKIKNIVLPKTLKHIGSGAFSKCMSLKKVYIPSTVEYVADTAFDQCTADIITYEEREELNKSSIILQPKSKKLQINERAVLNIELSDDCCDKKVYYVWEYRKNLDNVWQSRVPVTDSSMITGTYSKGYDNYEYRCKIIYDGRIEYSDIARISWSDEMAKIYDEAYLYYKKYYNL